MRIYANGKRGIYWVRATLADGRRIKRSTGTTDRAAAEEWAARLIADAWRQKRLGEPPSVSWDEAALAWLQTYGSARRSIEDIKDRLRWLTSKLSGRRLADIDSALLTAELDRLDVCNATRNRYLAEARKILRFAAARRWLHAAPSLPAYPEEATDYRWITHDQAAQLLAELPPHLNTMARFALATGLRESNVRLLRWRHVDLDRALAWVPGADAKAGKALNVPLNADALAVLREVQGQHGVYVFTYARHNGKREPVTKCSNHAWRKATRRAGVDGLRWHDLRHTWATWHVLRGTPLAVLQRLGGWSSLAMVMRYAHVAEDFAAQFADGSLLARPNSGPNGAGAGTVERQPLDSMGWPMGLEPTTTGITKGVCTSKVLNLNELLSRKQRKTA